MILMMPLFKKIVVIVMLFSSVNAVAASILILMDEHQKNHLKAYGVAYWVLQNELEIEWLLNYRGGSFLLPHHNVIEEELTIRGVSYEVIADGQAISIKRGIANPEVNQDVVKLETAPK